MIKDFRTNLGIGLRLAVLIVCATFCTVCRAAYNAASDSIADEQEDSLQILSRELAQVKSRLGEMEKEDQLAKIWKRRKYLKIGMANSNIERMDGETMKWDTDYSFFIQKGKTAYLHSEPLGGMVKIGIDYGFLGLNYTKLKLKTVEGAAQDGGSYDYDSDEPNGSILSSAGLDLGMHKFEYAPHVGLSVSVNPWDHLILAAYFHVLPTASGILENDKFSYGFGCATSCGISVSYKAFSLGLEGLWSTIRYTQTSFDEEDDYYYDDYDGEEFSLFDTKKFKLKQSGLRFYIALRF